MLFVLLLVSFVHAQQRWTRTYGGIMNDVGNSVQQTQNGGYIIAGTTSSFGAGYNDVYLIKTDSLGDTLWTKTYGGSSDDGGCSVRITRDGGFVIAGYTNSLNWRSYIYLIKTDSMGDTLWTRTYGDTSLSSSGCDVQQTIDGGYIVLGNTRDSIKIIKTDSLGDTLWTKAWRFGMGANGSAIVQAADKGYAITGSASDAFNGYVMLLKTDSLGNESWQQYWGGPVQTACGGAALQQTSDGGYIITGVYCGVINPGDVYLIKTDYLGNAQVIKYYGGFGDDVGHSVQQTSDGGYIVAGYTTSFGHGYSDVYLIKTNATGDTLWTRTFGGSNGEQGNSIQLTRDGGYIIVGYTYSFGAGNDDVYLIKTDSSGRSSGVEEHPSPHLTPSTSRLTVTPNPFTSFATVLGHEQQRFALYDVSGRRVGVYKGDRIGEGLRAGVYFLKLKDGSTPPIQVVKVR